MAGNGLSVRLMSQKGALGMASVDHFTFIETLDSDDGVNKYYRFGFIPQGSTVEVVGFQSMSFDTPADEDINSWLTNNDYDTIDLP